MVVQQLPAQGCTVRVFLELDELPNACRPCRLGRRGAYTLVLADPRESRLAITAWCVEHLTEAERVAFLSAYGQPAETAVRAPDWTTESTPAFLYVPPPLRLRVAAPLQRGAELQRRYRDGQLAEEIAAYMAETATAASGA